MDSRFPGRSGGSDARFAGFAVRCDLAGVVQKLLLQDGEPCGSVLVGRSLKDSVDPDSRRKLEIFLGAGQGPQPAVGWEMSLPYSGGLRSLVFAAVREGDGLIVAASTGAIRLVHILDELSRTGCFAEAESARSLDQAVRALRTRAETEEGLFNELTLLYNELSVLQRELASKNAEVEKLNAFKSQFLAHLLQAREEERREVAREFHDELGQTLAALTMDLHWLIKRLGGEVAPLREKLQGTIALGELAIKTVQRIAADLRPRMLDDLGLAPALEQLGADFTRRTEIKCKVVAEIPPAFAGRNAATALYRIVQEALANVGRHSHADHASIRMTVADGMLDLRIEDDGIGITPQQAEAPGAYGLIGLRERVEGLGGTLSITGEFGRGTNVLVRIPLPPEGAFA